jgi:hypothetical protein
MALDFQLRDVMHRIIVKFFPAFLPDAKKAFNLRSVYQPELDVHDVASKAEVYNITTSPKVIEEGTLAFMELASYLAADGYKIKTPVFTLKVAIPGEYDGTETHLPDGIRPQGRLNIAPELRIYLREHIDLQFDGIEDNRGFIAEVDNLSTGEIDATLTPGALFEVRGVGLKIMADVEHASEAGLFLESPDGATRLQIASTAIAVNEPKTLKAIAPDASLLPSESQWYVVIKTQSSAKGHSGQLLKNIREMKSEFTVTAL